MRKDNLYESVKKFVKTRKEDLIAYFAASLQIRKFIISCCDNMRHWLWKLVHLIESHAVCRVWRLSRVAILIFYFFVNQALGFRVKAIKSSLPLPPPPLPPLLAQHTI